MYTLLHGFYQQYTQKEQFFVIILGLDNAGKTTLLERIKFIYNKQKPMQQIAPTVGLNVGKVNVHSCRINFWDLGGQKQLQSIWEKYYHECHAIMFVVDSTDRERIEECKVTLEKVINNNIVEGVPVLMLANKQDVKGALKLQEIQEIFNQIAVALEARDSKVLCVSALNGDGVKEAVEWMYTRLQRNKQEKPPVYI
ncbi:ADP-ribosylation factor protein 3 [Boothiomyces sp. JEL0866]|nr:ADP-ribosylation factor protein 3 [Boothiomyces sp. JEL0838]KAJ3318778.1 ADP-ribosylation factor protein 3 [Boothiomyces sp. JEL0866]